MALLALIGNVLRTTHDMTDIAFRSGIFISYMTDRLIRCQHVLAWVLAANYENENCSCVFQTNLPILKYNCATPNMNYCQNYYYFFHTR